MSNGWCTKECKPICSQYIVKNKCLSDLIDDWCSWVPNDFYSCDESSNSCVKTNNYLDFSNLQLCKNSCYSPPGPGPVPPGPGPVPPGPKPPSKQSKKSKKSHLLLWLIPLILIGLIFMGIFIYFNFF